VDEAGAGVGDAFDAVTVGETMAAFFADPAADDGNPRAAVYRVAPVGAESNVAIGMSQLGCRTRWVSRLGKDELGRLIDDFVVGYGVDTRIDWDDDRPTGICVKEVRQGNELTEAAEGRTRMRYYRSRSAASRLGIDQLGELGQARFVHVTGITLALSDAAALLVRAILEGSRADLQRVSFDVNYRPALWPDPTAAAETLLALAPKADVIFIGDDEAEALLGCSDEGALRERLVSRPDQELVIKRGGAVATVVTAAESVSEPGRRVPVVELRGAGDAFAAGYLAATCRGWSLSGRLQLGHFLASRVVGEMGDIGPVIDASLLKSFAEAEPRPFPQQIDAP
jgi:2-dehydro-3-deoxygluconokinase